MYLSNNVIIDHHVAFIYLNIFKYINRFINLIELKLLFYKVIFLIALESKVCLFYFILFMKKGDCIY